MRARRHALAGAAGAALLLSMAVWVVVGVLDAGASEEDPTPGALPAPAGALLFAQPFAVIEPYAHDWERERGRVRAGYLVVIETDPELCEPRQELNPVLYAGERVIERVSFGAPGGRVVGLLPVEELETYALESAPIFWGRPALPEQLHRELRSGERYLAEQSGVVPPTGAEVAAARAAAAEPIDFADRTALLRHAARLILTWAPAEAERARGMLAPLVVR